MNIMVKTSGIREQLRSSALKELARERGIKRKRIKEADDEEDREIEEQIKKNQEPLNSSLDESKAHSDNLLAILPKPKNENAFGPTVRLDKLLSRSEKTSNVFVQPQETSSRIAEDGMLEVDVGKVVGNVDFTNIKELTIEKSKSTVIVPKGKEKQKNQITYLAQLGRATELERKEQASLSRFNKAAARSKYGW